MNLQTNPLPKLQIRIKITKEGKVIRNTIEDGHSWTRNAWNIFAGFSLYSPGLGDWEITGRNPSAGTLMCRQTSGAWSAELAYRVGVSYKNNASYAGYCFYNNTTTDTFGVLVGRGDTAFSAEDYQLADLITTGTGSGQFNYLAQELLVANYDAITSKWGQSIPRVYNNNSGASINVAEVGLATYMGAWGGNTNYLLARDVLDTPVVVPNGAQLTVTYELSSPTFSIDTGYIELGTLGSGGYVSHYKYDDADTLIIVAPLSGGYSTTVDFADGGNVISCYDLWDGQANTTRLIDSYLAVSDIATFCKNANDTNLGGFNDWYIPARSQLSYLSKFKDSAPAGEEWVVSDHWSSSARDSSDVNSYYSPMDGSTDITLANNSTQNDVRLIRDCAVVDWSPV